MRYEITIIIIILLIKMMIIIIKKIDKNNKNNMLRIQTKQNINILLKTWKN